MKRVGPFGGGICVGVCVCVCVVCVWCVCGVCVCGVCGVCVCVCVCGLLYNNILQTRNTNSTCIIGHISSPLNWRPSRGRVVFPYDQLSLSPPYKIYVTLKILHQQFNWYSGTPL